MQENNRIKWSIDKVNLLKILVLKKKLRPLEVGYIFECSPIAVRKKIKKLGFVYPKSIKDITQDEFSKIVGLDIRLSSLLRQRYNSLKSKSQKRGWKFEITLFEFIELFISQNNICFYTGEQMSLDLDGCHSISVDRLDSKSGYTQENIVFCKNKINIMKAGMDLGNFYNWCELIVNNYGK